MAGFGCAFPTVKAQELILRLFPWDGFGALALIIVSKYLEVFKMRLWESRFIPATGQTNGGLWPEVERHLSHPHP